MDSELINKKCVFIRRDGSFEIGIYKGADNLSYHIFDEKNNLPSDIPIADIKKIIPYTGRKHND